MALMRHLDNRDVDEAVAEMMRVLGPHVTKDWTVPAGPVEWSCWTTAAHVAHDLLAYAGQLAARPADAYLPFDVNVRPGIPPHDVLRVIAASGALLSCALAKAGPDVRAWHWGATDPTGFAAMGVAEVLLHTHDITQGLGVRWLLPGRCAPRWSCVSSPMLRRVDTAQVLLWCTGRSELPGHPRRTSWTWQAALPD
jgi:hypothetical protein